MKVLSIFLTVFLLDPILYFLLHVLALYDNEGSLKGFGFSDKVITQVAMPSIILIAIYSAAFLVSIFLNVKKKYLVNSIFLGTMIASYFIIALFLKLA